MACFDDWLAGRDLVNSDLIATLATPNKLGDVSWVKPEFARGIP
jgi:hypothetical protein